MRPLATLLVLALLAPRIAAVEPEPSAARFTTVDIIVDAGTDSLAAYQIEIIADGDAKIVGVEGGDDAAFNAPPAYDPAALQRGRIIVAAFSTRTSLPSGRIRVAVLHMREAGTVTYHARLMAAARADGSRFEPAVSAMRGGEE
jgi:hypothetical protein